MGEGMTLREHKFRAWSNGIKKGSRWIFEPQMMYDEKLGDCLVWKSQGQNIEVMQWTGLKDRNGVEIYEGDILNTTSSNFEIWYVDYKPAAFMANQGNTNYDCSLSDFMTTCTVEVVGNIYQHPHLLPKEDEQ